MPTIVETVAGATSNSYLTVAEADALATNDLGPDAKGWLTAARDDKERALIRATRECDAFLGSAGEVYTTLQALLFPRSIDVTDAIPPVPYLHVNVRMACYEQATYVLANAKLLDEAATRRSRGLVQWADDSGSGSPSIDPLYGRMSPDAIAYLRAVGGDSTRPKLYSVRMARPGAA